MHVFNSGFTTSNLLLLLVLLLLLLLLLLSLELQSLVNISLFQNCLPLLSALLISPPVPHAHVL
jgi:hypothetical protein